jgi:amidase
VFGPVISSATQLGGLIAGREVTADDVEPLTWALYQRAGTQSKLRYLAALSRLEDMARSVVAYLGRFDAVLTPALALRPVRVGEIHGRGPDPWGNYQRSGYFTPYTAVLNITGQPAISLPLYHGQDGLPAAVQLIGPPAREDVLLALAGELEVALPWGDRRAPIATQPRS